MRMKYNRGMCLPSAGH